MRLLRKVLLFLVPIILIIVSGIYYYAVNNILPYSPIRPHRITKNEITKLYSQGINPAMLGLRYSQFNITVEDSIPLKGWYVFATTDTSFGTLILLHGIASCKESNLGFADTLAHLGYNSILFDLRAHGESGGINCTFGYYEKKDIAAYIDSTLTRYDDVLPIGIYGNSLGSAIALQALELDKRLSCGIVESPFANLRDIVYDYWVRMSGIPLRFISNQALTNSERIAHFVADSVNPAKSAKQIFQPVLVIHGEKDIHVSVEYGKRVYKNLPSPAKEWYSISDADHYNIRKVAGPIYMKTIQEFLMKYLRKQI